MPSAYHVAALVLLAAPASGQDYEVSECDGAQCYHGSTCKSTGRGYYCDCQELNEKREPGDSKFAGSLCEHESTSLCAVSLVGVTSPNLQFCTNHGKCVRMVSGEEPHPGCICDSGWDGDHCEIPRDPFAKVLGPEFDCPDCKPGAGTGRFCGYDGECRPYSCSAYYEFGPRNYTGYDEASPVPLECEDIPEATFGFSSAVLYRCYDTVEPVEQGFTRKCHAQPSGPNTDFTCYEMAAGTDFQPFLERVNQSGLACPDDPNEEGYPKFTYGVRVFHTGGGYFAPGFNGTMEFDEGRAMNGTMYTEYRVVPTPAPTPAPTPPPTPSSSTRCVLQWTVLGVTSMGWMWQLL